jgi:hypothetical protein
MTWVLVRFCPISNFLEVKYNLMEAKELLDFFFFFSFYKKK